MTKGGNRLDYTSESFVLETLWAGSAAQDNIAAPLLNPAGGGARSSDIDGGTWRVLRVPPADLNRVGPESIFYESGFGAIRESSAAGVIRAEGENRPSRPAHLIIEGNPSESAPVERPYVYTGLAESEDVAAPLMSNSKGQRTGDYEGATYIVEEPVAAFDHRWSGRYKIGDGSLSPTVKVSSEPAIASECGDTTIVRRLTPLECERLMGWDDLWTEWGIDDAGDRIEIAETHRYRICGNGIVANVTEWIGRRLT